MWAWLHLEPLLLKLVEITTGYKLSLTAFVDYIENSPRLADIAIKWTFTMIVNYIFDIAHSQVMLLNIWALDCIIKKNYRK